ncbi:MAG: H-NS histone family protein [Rubrivivax sp.]|nr:H-NS histone family protein [Rubrivivax sp.]
MATRKAGPSLTTLTAQIAKLQTQADALRKKEVAEVVAKVRTAIAHYRLTAADLGLGTAVPKASKPAVGTTVKKARRKAAGKKPARPAKYKDGQGNTWGGIGKRPDWFKAALVAGKKPEELLA